MTQDRHAHTPVSLFDAAADELVKGLLDGGRSTWSAARFEQQAFENFRHQFEGCPPYRALCEAKGVTPAHVTRWQDVPMVPAAAFKHFDLTTEPGRAPEAVFRTSGTTRGADGRGRHAVLRLDLYRASLAEPFRSALLPGDEAISFLSFIPSPGNAPDSSLSYMVGAAAESFASAVHWLVDAAGRWDPVAVRDVVRAARDEREPVLLLGTALAFVNILEGDPEVLAGLPAGSRIMETGGFKGARRRVPREELYEQLTRSTGIPLDHIVNEYGMTELLSQLYEPVLSEGLGVAGSHQPAPWLRVRALDPVTLAELPEGEEGVLAFFDLANLGSVSHVLTEDVGSVRSGRLHLRGRAAGSEPRGCSRAMDELMAAAGHG